MQNKGKVIAKIEGSWIKNLIIGGKEYWNLEDGTLP